MIYGILVTPCNLLTEANTLVISKKRIRRLKESWPCSHPCTWNTVDGIDSSKNATQPLKNWHIFPWLFCGPVKVSSHPRSSETVWETSDFLNVSSTTQKLAETNISKISDNLHDYYVNELRVSTYSLRQAQLFKLISFAQVNVYILNYGKLICKKVIF